MSPRDTYDSKTFIDYVYRVIKHDEDFYSCPVVAQFKANCFKIIVVDAALVRGQCQPKILRNWDNYWFVAVISV